MNFGGIKNYRVIKSVIWNITDFWLFYTCAKQSESIDSLQIFRHKGWMKNVILYKKNFFN